MKSGKNYVIALSAALLLLTSCNTTRRYGCRGGRCIVQHEKQADSKVNS